MKHNINKKIGKKKTKQPKTLNEDAGRSCATDKSLLAEDVGYSGDRTGFNVQQINSDLAAKDMRSGFDDDLFGNRLNNNERDLLKDDSWDSSDSFDYSLTLRQDAKGMQVLDRKLKKKREGKGMAKIDELRRRGLIYGKKGSVNFRRSFKTKISQKKIDLTGIDVPNYSSQEDFDDMTGMSSADDVLSHKSANFCRSFHEDVVPASHIGYFRSFEWLD